MRTGLLMLAISLMFAWSAAADAKIISNAVPYRHGQTELEGYLAWDDSVSGKRPGILVVHEWWGLNDYVKRRADQLAGLGFVAFAVDMYGKGKVTAHPKEAGEWAEQMRNNIELWRDRARTGLDVLLKNSMVDAGRVAAIGYCFGGSTVQQLAFSGADIKGVVSFHGGLVPPAEGQKPVKAKILICHGAADQSVRPEALTGYIASMDKAGLDWRLIVYGGARHGFTNPDADKKGIANLAYNKAADERSWADMMTFFEEVL